MTTSLFENTETAFEYQSTPALKKAKFLFQLFGNNALRKLGYIGYQHCIIVAFAHFSAF
jgi:hypothetical protein